MARMKPKERSLSNTFSLPQRLHDKIEKESHRLGVNRSKYLQLVLDGDVKP